MLEESIVEAPIMVGGSNLDVCKSLARMKVATTAAMEMGGWRYHEAVDRALTASGINTRCFQ